MFELLLVADDLGIRLCTLKGLDLMLGGRWLGNCRLMELYLLVLLTLGIDNNLLSLLRYWALNHNLVPAPNLVRLCDDLDLGVEWQLMLLRPRVRIDDELLNLRGWAVENRRWLIHGDVCDQTGGYRLHALSVFLLGFLFHFRELVFSVFLRQLDGLWLVEHSLWWGLLDDVWGRNHECSVALDSYVLLTVGTSLKYLLLRMQHVLDRL